MDKVRRFSLLHSRAFWFGVPGLVFLLWAWADSKIHGFMLNSDGNAYGVGLYQMNGDVILTWGDNRDLSNWRWEISHEVVEPNEAEEAKAVLKWVSSALEMKMISISHRWLALAYVAGWAGLLAWRKRYCRAVSPGESTA
jgi:hypothetical protein